MGYRARFKFGFIQFGQKDDVTKKNDEEVENILLQLISKTLSENGVD